MKSIFMMMFLLALSACADKSVSFATLEEAKNQANENALFNALFNAQNYRQGNVLYSGWAIVANGDSSQMPNCPQGDGWATLKLVRQDRAQIVKIKCSTVSGATGCMQDDEFQTKSYASEDGHCQPTDKVPFPLPKIAK